jgi:hypothetical protein
MNAKVTLAVAVLLVCFCSLDCDWTIAASPPAGKVVWWGWDIFSENGRQTNGVVEINDEILSNVVSIAAHTWDTLLLRDDGTVVGLGFSSRGANNAPPGLSNVVSIGDGGGWAIKRDGTLITWGFPESMVEVFTKLKNVKSLTSAGFQSSVVLRDDGTVLGLRFDLFSDTAQEPVIGPLKVNGRPLTDVVAIVSAGITPYMIKKDGTLYNLKVERASDGSMYGTADPVIISDQPATNVSSVATAEARGLILRKNGTVEAFGTNYNDSGPIPKNLTDVVAVALSGSHNLALRRNGTVIAWGYNHDGESSVPAGLSNVVAIAAGQGFSMAITTGNIPSSVYLRPHGRLEQLSQEADLVFKGQVESTAAITNELFPYWGKAHATVFKILSVLQGHADTNKITLWHLTHGPDAWGGGSMPAWHEFKPGECYLVFADALDKPEYIYTIPPDAKNRPNEFRQTYLDGFTRTLDSLVLKTSSVKEAHWQELNLMLHNSNPTNVLYAIEKLDRLSFAGRDDDRWQRNKDFKRARVLTALLPLTRSANEQIAVRALNCFATDSNAVASLQPFAKTLIEVANTSRSSKSRIEAISSLSGTHGEEVSSALLQLLNDKDENVRVSAVRLVPRFPINYAVPALRREAGDASANVRSVVADVIGDGRFVELLPTLAKLFEDPVGKDSPIEPLTKDQLITGHRWSNIGDVHTSAGFSLVKFPPGEVSAILKTNLDDPGFHISFVAKLAQGDPEPWLPELVSILEARHAYVVEFDKLPRDDPKRYADSYGDKMLTGVYTKCWEDIRQYLLKQSPDKLVSAENQRYMDLLEKMVRHSPSWPDGGVEEARWLYQLYWTKNLKERAQALRRKFDKTEGWWFDAFEKGIRGEADPVNAPVF